MSKLEFNEICEHYQKARKMALDDNYDSHEAERFAEGYYTARAEMLKDAVVVYNTDFVSDNWNILNVSNRTHKALLINITEIEKKPCEHTPKFTSNAIENVCKWCDKPLKAKWIVDE